MPTNVGQQKPVTPALTHAGWFSHLASVISFAVSAYSALASSASCSAFSYAAFVLFAAASFASASMRTAPRMQQLSITPSALGQQSPWRAPHSSYALHVFGRSWASDARETAARGSPGSAAAARAGAPPPPPQHPSIVPLSAMPTSVGQQKPVRPASSHAGLFSHLDSEISFDVFAYSALASSAACSASAYASCASFTAAFFSSASFSSAAALAAASSASLDTSAARAFVLFAASSSASALMRTAPRMQQSSITPSLLGQQSPRRCPHSLYALHVFGRLLPTEKTETHAATTSFVAGMFCSQPGAGDRARGGSCTASVAAGP